MADKALYWSCIDVEYLRCSTLDEAVEEYLDGYDGEYVVKEPEALFRALGDVTVTGYAHAELDAEHIAETTLEDAIGRLYEYADPEDEVTPHARMKDAARAFGAAGAADFDVWLCEPVCQETVNALKWVQENAPHWLKPSK